MIRKKIILTKLWFRKKYELLTKEIKLLDADISIVTLLKHIGTNFSYGLLGGLAISAISLGNPLLIAVAYYALKKTESKIINREKYTSKLGKDYIYPIPATIGVLIGWKISTLVV